MKESKGLTVSMDCPYTAKGDEFFPTNLVEAALGGCLLLAMGAIAARHEIDLAGSRVGVKISATDKPVMRFSEVDVKVFLPGDLSESQRTMLERAADGCPIKHSFGSDIPVTVAYKYEDALASARLISEPATA